MKMHRKSRVRRGVAAALTVGVLSLGGAGLASAAPVSSATPASAAVTTSGRPTAAPGQAVGKCADVGSKHFAKTRFLFHAALGVGAFHRYLYKPLKNGGFVSGADKRIRTFLKAAVAGAFVVHEVEQMKTFAEADKTLCKMVPSFEGITTAVTGFIAKLKGGSASDADLTTVSSPFDSVQSQAGGLGATIKDRVVGVPGA